MTITTDEQEAFSFNYSTNRLGKHNITFSSDPLSNGSVSIPYSLDITYNDSSFITLEVGTDEDTYTSTTGSLTIKKGNNTLFNAILYAKLTLGASGSSADDFPAGDFSANLKFEVAIE